MSGVDVLQLQQRLYDLGYVDIGQPDGVFGPKTDRAVRLFQERNGLVIDGIVGPTLAAPVRQGGCKEMTWTLGFS